MNRRNALLLPLAGLALSACGQAWETAYDSPPAAAQSVSWRASQIVVAVPESLTVSEANTYAPDADIVWRGEPAGDRHAQVRALMHEAVSKGAARLSGKGRGVRIEVTVAQFHALTEKTRTTLQRSGVHNIDFSIRVTDHRTGELLAAEDNIQADLIGFTGTKAAEAEAMGQTQRVRIVNHVADVVAAWLGTGPDVRAKFSRLGR